MKNIKLFYHLLGEKVKKKQYYHYMVLVMLVILGYIVPTIIHDVPYGTDAYRHLFYTQIMSQTYFLSEFYKICLENNYMTYYDYPFGLWLFGSVVVKITGLDLIELSRILPFGCFIILLFLYYSFSKIFLGELTKNSLEYQMFSLVFLLSMPLMAISILNYSPSKFVMFLTIFILYLTLLEKLKFWRKLILLNISIFVLCFTHAGTYMFLIFLTIILLFAYSILIGKFNNRIFILSVLIMIYFILTIHIFPNIHQYENKGRLLVSVGKLFSFGFFTLPTQLSLIHI